jgi:predicted nuclease of predicted toxin-antitoxin system
MRILAGENLPRPLVEMLRKQGHEIERARTDCPGMKDRSLLERAEANGRLVFTLDKDFWLPRASAVGPAQASRGDLVSVVSSDS